MEKFKKNKTKAATIALVLMLTTAATLITVLAVNAQTVHYIDSHIYVHGTPNPVGVGQTLRIIFWHDKEPPETPYDAKYQTNGSRAAWVGITVTVTKPDGTTQTLGPFKTEATGVQFTTYEPDTVGTYYLQSHFPGQWKNDTTNQPFYRPAAYFGPASSKEYAVQVQEEPVEYYHSGAPLPTEYWTRPIEAQNREWYTIGGNWLGLPLTAKSGYNETGRFNPYTTAPNTPHVVWTKPVAFGGVAGGDLARPHATYYWNQYDYKWDNFGGFAPVVIGGRLYYNQRLGPVNFQGLSCIDIRTGEEIWFKNGTNISFGQLLNFNSPNQHGVHAYLWNISTTTFKMYDAWTGDWILDIANSPITQSFFQLNYRVAMDDDGHLIVYVLDQRNNWLAKWNATNVFGMISTRGYNPETGEYIPGTKNEIWRWRPILHATLDWQTGVQWNVTITRPKFDHPSEAISIVAISDEVILLNERVGTETNMARAFDAKTGQHLWTNNMTTGCAFRPYFFWTEIADGKIAWWRQETKEWYCFDAYTGKQLWVSEPYEGNSQFSMFLGEFSCIPTTSAYGKFYYGSWDGTLNCIDWETGERLWNYTSENSGAEVAFNYWPLNGGPVVADGKVFMWTQDHSPDSPIFRGARLHCVNATTGEGIWTVYGWYESPIVVDGYVLTYNHYDGQIYCIGKGPSAVTVSIQTDVITHGSSVLIKGMVTDTSPGTEQYGLGVRFPNGVPAIADEYMSEWMHYLYMQKPQPAGVKGVEVVIEVLDPNNNYYEVGRTASDADGFFKLTFEPEVPGEYTVIATFEGSESYWPSQAETAINVEEAPPPVEEPEEAADNTPMFMGIIAAVAVAIVIGIVNLYALRKRK